MNRLLVGGCLLVLFGCGGRTDYFGDEDGPFEPGAGGAHAIAGGPNAKGGSPSWAGAPNFDAGAPGIGGAPSVSVGGRANITAGAPGVGGRANSTAGAGGGLIAAGAPGFGGAPNSKGGTSGFSGAPNGKAGSPGAGASPGVIQACQVIAGNSCQQCLCTTCSSQIVDCLSNFGCALILACAQQSGCQGLACYSAQTCRPVIDQFGGLSGKSMGSVLSLLTCSVASQNNCSCN
jgi:hypothetical protein